MEDSLRLQQNFFANLICRILLELQLLKNNNNNKK